MNNARALTLSLRGQWHGRYGAAPCPICQPDRRKGQNALTLSDAPVGRLLAHCKKSGCSFSDLARALGLAPGDFARPDPAEIARAEALARAEAEKRARQALALWREALPINGTPAETYLRGRGLSLDLPASLRFHPAAWHGAPIAMMTGRGDLPGMPWPSGRTRWAGKYRYCPRRMGATGMTFSP